MRKINFGANFAVFVLFFGLSLLSAFQNRDWIQAVFWLLVGVVFLVADNINKNRQRRRKNHGNRY